LAEGSLREKPPAEEGVRKVVRKETFSYLIRGGRWKVRDRKMDGNFVGRGGKRRWNKGHKECVCL